MAAVWVLTTPKGGAGKTTLALVLAGELARLGKTVEIIDADANAPMLAWAAKGRCPQTVTVTQAAGEAGGLRAQIALAKSRASFTLIDTEGTNNALSTFAIASADLVIVPMQASPEHARHAVRAVEFCAEVGHMRGAEVPTVVILNRMSAVRD
ncbi:MAG: ParA family protein, partial [Rhodobacteraceae bacterium]|nr:ParA family protein [Paracoccaceae bacterium]